MNTLERMLGGPVQLVAASGETAVDEGYQAYAMQVRVDNTQVLAMTKIENDDAASSVVDDLSWMTQNLKAGIDYIPLEDPIISITLASSTDSVMLFLEKRKQS